MSLSDFTSISGETTVRTSNKENDTKIDIFPENLSSVKTNGHSLFHPDCINMKTNIYSIRNLIIKSVTVLEIC